MTIGIPHDANLDLLPSWKENKGLVTVRCGNEKCGRSATLRDGPTTPIRKDGTRGHDIDDDGIVSPSIVCPYCREYWHIWGKLLGWREFYGR